MSRADNRLPMHLETFQVSPSSHPWLCNFYNSLILGKGASQMAQWVKEYACNAGDVGSIPGSGRHPGEENGYLLQYSCLKNPTGRGAWQATVHGVIKEWDERWSAGTFSG